MLLPSIQKMIILLLTGQWLLYDENEGSSFFPNKDQRAAMVAPGGLQYLLSLSSHEAGP